MKYKSVSSSWEYYTGWHRPCRMWIVRGASISSFKFLPWVAA